jgi:hypothetical protein
MEPDPTSPASRPDGPPARLPAPRLGDLAEQLLLPRLLRAGPVAARPERVFAGFVALVMIGGLGALLNGSSGDGAFGMALRHLDTAGFGLGDAVLRADIPNLADRARLVLLEAPGAALGEAPLATIALVILAAAVWGITGLFIARGAAMEIGRGLHLRLSRLVAFQIVKGPAAVLALLLAPLAASVFLLVPLVLGLLMLVPGLDILAGAIYGLALLASVISAFLLLAWLVASWMLVPAVACDGADAFDATQRAFGMLLGRPLGVLVHAAVAVVQGVVLVALVWIVADLGVGFAGAVAGLAGESASAVVTGSAAMAEEGGTRGTASALVVIWTRVPFLLAISYGVSYAHAASTAVYLNARKMVDGQEPSELWMPGDAAGVVEINPPERRGAAAGPGASGPAPDDADPGSAPPRG